jgi:hypothetical protein
MGLLEVLGNNGVVFAALITMVQATAHAPAGPLLSMNALSSPEYFGISEPDET